MDLVTKLKLSKICPRNFHDIIFTISILPTRFRRGLEICLFQRETMLLKNNGMCYISVTPMQDLAGPCRTQHSLARLLVALLLCSTALRACPYLLDKTRTIYIIEPFIEQR